MQFNEIKSTKRSHIDHLADNKLLELPGVVDPSTGRILTVGEAIKLRLLDIRTGEIILISGERMSLEKAAKLRLINPELAVKLGDHLQAVQRELSEAETGPESTEKRIKVTTTTTTISDHIKTIAEAIKDGTVDPIQGIYNMPDGSQITITEAYKRGLLIKNETVKIKSTPLCLADAIAHGIVDQSGWIMDRNAGDKYRLDSAIANDLILANLKEIVDTRNDVKITVNEAIEMGLLNAKTGRYVNPVTKEKLTFVEAKNRQLIVRPMTLRDVCDLNLMDREGMIISPTRKTHLDILQSIKVGLLDGDEINSISKGDDGELITLNEAIGVGIVGPKNSFKNISTGEEMTIQKAVDRGFISSVSQKSIFDIDGFKDPYSGEFVSLNEAISKDILVKSNDNFMLDSGKRNLVSISEGIEKDLIRPEVNEMLNRRVGVFDNKRKELSVLDLVLYDMIDPKSGYLLDFNKETFVPLNLAIDREMITPEGALLLSSLLNITLTTERVTNIEKRYITIANAQISDYSEPTKPQTYGGLELADAIKEKVFDPSTGILSIPQTDRSVNFEECIQLGIINPESMRIVDPKYKEEITVHRALDQNILDTTGKYHSQDGWLPMDKGIESGVIILNEGRSKPGPSTKTLEISYALKTTPSKTSESDLASPEPLEISPGVIYDPSTALVINMKTGKSENILQAVKDNLVNPQMVQIMDKSTGHPISIEEALKKGLISPQSGEVMDSGRKINLIDAVKMGLLVVAGAPLVAAAGAINSLKMVFDPSTNQQIPIELAYERGLVSRDELSDFTLSDSIPKSAVISQASSFDIETPKDMARTPSRSRQHSGIYEDDSIQSDDKTRTRMSYSPMKDISRVTSDAKEDLPISSQAIKSQTPSYDTVDEPLKHHEILPQVSVNEALQRGLLDLKNGTFLDPVSHKVIPIQEAINKGHLIGTSDNIEEEILNISPIHEKSIAKGVGIKTYPALKTTTESIMPEEELRAFISQHEINRIMNARPRPKSQSGDQQSSLDDIQKLLETQKSIIEQTYSEDLQPVEDQLLSYTQIPISSLGIHSDRMNFDDNLSQSIAKLSQLQNKDDVLKNLIEQNAHGGIPLSETSQFYSVLQESSHVGSAVNIGHPIDMMTVDYPQHSAAISSVPEKLAESEIRQVTEVLSSLYKEIPKDDSSKKFEASSKAEKTQEIILSINKAGISTADDLKKREESKAVSSSKEHAEIIDNQEIKGDVAIESVKEINKTSAGNLTKIEEAKGNIDSSETAVISLETAKVIPKPKDEPIAEEFVPELCQTPSEDVNTDKKLDIASNIADAAKLGLMALVGAPVLAGMAIADSVKNVIKKSEEKSVILPDENFAKQQSAKDKMVFSTIQEMSESIMSDHMQSEEQKPAVKIDDKITPENLEELGAFDKRTGAFVDPATGDKVSFDDFIYNCGVFDPELIYVKDFSIDHYVPLPVALEKVLIDRHTGIMVEPKTGKRIPFFECLKRQWIIQKEPQKTQTITLKEARESGVLNDENGKIVVDGISISINEALNSGILDVDAISIRNSSGEVVPLSLAVAQGIVDIKRGTILNPQTDECKSLENAFRDGELIEGIKCPLSLEAAVNSGLYDSDSKKIRNDDKLLTVQEAIDSGIINATISEVKDIKLNQMIPLQKALADGILDDGQLKDTTNNKLIPLDDALKQQLISTKQIKMTLIDTIVKEFFKADLQKVLNPMSGKLQTIEEGIEDGFVDIDTTLVVDENEDRVVPAKTAIESGLLDVKDAKLNNPDLSLFNAYQRGYILSSKKPISLADALVRNLYDPITGKLKPQKSELTLEQCIQSGEVSTNDLIIHDPKSKNIISVNDAIKSGLLDAKQGCVNEPFSGEKISFNDAVDRGIIILSKHNCSLPEAVFKGLYDPQSGTFANTTTTEKLSTERAIKRGFIDPQSTIVNIGGKILPFELSVENGMVDTKRGTITDEYGNKVDFREAFDRGLLVEVRKPIGLYEALVKGIYDEESGLFMDPQSGKHLTLEQAIGEKLIDPNSIQIKDKTGTYKDISLLEAIHSGMIDDTSHMNVDSRNLTLKQAFDVGILWDSKAPISIQRAIHQGSYDSESGKITDPKTNKKMTLHEAMRRWTINPQLPCYFNENEECLLSLGECCRLKMIDRREGVFKEPGSNAFVPLNEAMGLGLIVDIESGGFGLYEMLTMKLYDVDSGKFINPANGRLITMHDAITDDLISLVSSLVKNSQNGAYLKLNEAIDANIIDTNAGVYVYPNKQRINLQEARKLGLIVSNQKLLSLENAIKMGLYRPESGKFVDPSTNDEFDLQLCIDNGLIDGETTVIKDFATGQDKPIKQAIECSDVDVVKGRVVDSESKMSNNFNDAFNKGMLVTVQKPLTGRSMERNESLENILKSESSAPTLPKEMSLTEAIAHGIINPEIALIKNPKTGQFQIISKVLEDDGIDATRKITIDASATVFTFDPTCVVYTRAPETFENAVESGRLNLSDGSYTNPDQAIKYNLKEAITMGLIDPESALIKDGAHKKLIKLPEAFRKGLIDSDKFNVVDTSTSKLMSLKVAVDDAILVTPKRSLDLLEALNFNLYESPTGTFNDPFITALVPLTLQEAIAKGLIDPSTTVVKDMHNKDIEPLHAAIASGLIDPINGRLVTDTEPFDFIRARDKGLLLPAEQRVSNSVGIAPQKLC